MRAFVASPKRVSELLGHLELIRPDQWEPKFVDTRDGQHWIGYRLDDNPGGLPPKLFRLANLSITHVCERAAQSPFDDEVAASAHYIRWQACSDEALICLVSSLEAAVAANPDERTLRNVQIALGWSGLHELPNFRAVLNKTPDQVQNDYSFYASLSQRSATLAAIAEKSLGYGLRKDSSVFVDC